MTPARSTAERVGRIIGGVAVSVVVVAVSVVVVLVFAGWLWAVGVAAGVVARGFHWGAGPSMVSDLAAVVVARAVVVAAVVFSVGCCLDRLRGRRVSWAQNAAVAAVAALVAATGAAW